MQFAIDCDLASHLVDQLFADAQAKACSPGVYLFVLV